MEIKSLENTPLPQIVKCFSEAFADYVVKMPEDPGFWEKRWKSARVRYDLSFGAFEKGEMVGFIINGIDEDEGHMTAFNTGTGVIPAFRGKRIVDKIYENAIPHFKHNGVTRLSLEVIKSNARAIRVYERIGFEIKKHYLCFKGELNLPEGENRINKISREALLKIDNPNENFYSWDNSNNAIKNSPEGLYESFLVKNKDTEVGFFTINPANGYLAQAESFLPASAENRNNLFAGIQQVSQNVRINNVDAKRSEFIKDLKSVGLENHIDQYEMECFL